MTDTLIRSRARTHGLYIPTLFASLAALAACGGSGDPTPHNFGEIHFEASALKKDAGVEKNSVRPAGVAAAQSKLFVALGNLTVDCMAPAGPGYVAVIDLEDADTSEPYRLIELGDDCRNPQNVLTSADEDKVYVSCSGQFGFGETASEAVAAIDASSEKVLFKSRVGCDAESEGCRPITPGKMALLADGSLAVGDSGSGTLFHIDGETGETDSTLPKGVTLCPPSPVTQYQMIGDVFVTGESIFATCFETGELAFLSDKFMMFSSQVAGSGAQLLAMHGSDKLLLGDTLDNVLYEFDASDGTPRKLPGGDRLGQAANQILVRGDTAFVITSTDNTVQVIDLSKERPAQVGTERTVRQISTSSAASPDATNTNPYLGVLNGSSLFVTLMGKCTVDGDRAGNSIIRIDVGE